MSICRKGIAYVLYIRTTATVATVNIAIATTVNITCFCCYMHNVLCMLLPSSSEIDDPNNSSAVGRVGGVLAVVAQCCHIRLHSDANFLDARVASDFCEGRQHLACGGFTSLLLVGCVRMLLLIARQHRVLRVEDVLRRVQDFDGVLSKRNLYSVTHLAHSGNDATFVFVGDCGNGLDLVLDRGEKGVNL